MFQKTKNIPINIPAILLCLILVFSFYVFSIRANPGAKVQFTADTIISLTGITDGDLYIAQNSECDSLSVSGSTLTVNDIPDGSSFILKTSSHNNALKITPSGGVLDLTFASGNLSSGSIIQWTLEGSNPTQAVHIVGTPEANKWYAVKVNGVLLNNYQSDASNEISFTYSGGFSSKVFTVEGGSAPGGGLPPAAYNPPSQPEPDSENPEGGFSVLINNGDEYTNNETVTLKLYAGPDTARMAISNTEDFEYASQILYEEEIEWKLSACGTGSFDSFLAQDDSSICTVYVKFYTQYGVVSEVVSDSIILKTATIETETEERSEDSNQDKPVSETEDDKNPESDKNSESDKTESAKQSSSAFTKTIQFNSNNNQVSQLQNKLKELGFFPEEIKSNGNFGPATEQAVIEYQKSKGIYPCGIVGPRTRKALNDEEFITNKDHQFTQDLKYNDKNEEVKQLQTRLRDQNFFPYNVKSTGWFGSITQKAVKFFQKFYNLIQSGIVDSKMREVLNR